MACLAVAISSLWTWYDGSAYLLAGGPVYLGGSFIVTIVFNVPRNNTLAAVDPSSAAGATLWENFVPSK